MALHPSILMSVQPTFHQFFCPFIHLSIPPSVRPTVLLATSLTMTFWPLRLAGHPRGERVWRRAQLMPHPPRSANDQWLTTNDWESWRRWFNFLLDKDAHSWTSDCCCVEGRRPAWTMWPVYIIQSAGALSSMLKWVCPLEAGRGFLLPDWVLHFWRHTTLPRSLFRIWRAPVTSCWVESSRRAGDRNEELGGRGLTPQTAVCCSVF